MSKVLALYGEDITIEYKRFEKVTSVCECVPYRADIRTKAGQAQGSRESDQSLTL